MNFVDTGPFLALHLAKDQYHDLALRKWRKHGPLAVSSNHVIDELATILARRAGYLFAADCVSNIYAAPTIEIIQSTREDELEALRWMLKFADQGVSFTDCVVMAVADRLGTKLVFGFDELFRKNSYRLPAAPNQQEAA